MYAIFYDFYAFIYKTTFFSVHIPIISDSYTISWLRVRVIGRDRV